MKKFISQIQSEARYFKSLSVLIAIGIGILISAITAISAGNFILYKVLVLPRKALPAFLFYLLYILFGGLLSMNAGLVWNFPCQSKKKNSSFLFLLLGFLFLILWYIAFFKTVSFIFAFLLLLSVVILLVCSLKECLSVGILPSLFCILSLILLMHFVYFNISVILLN